MHLRRLGVIACVLILGACSDDDEGSGFDPRILFGAGTTEVVVEVDYQDNAEPYVSSSRDPTFNYWREMFGDNIKDLFSKYERTYTIPDSLAEMQKLTGVTAMQFTADDIQALESQFRSEFTGNGRAAFYILFLDGYFKDDDGVHRNVMGVTVGTSGLVALFKPVIEDVPPIVVGGQALSVAPFAEQSTLVHEFGHAAGLVNRGIPLRSAHHDSAHGSHCTNEMCVMYYLNEGPADLADYIMRAEMTMQDRPRLYGEECISDALRADE